MKATTFRELLLKNGLTQKEFADRVGVAPATVSRWLDGSRQPRASKLRTISKVLKIKIEDFLKIGE